MITLRIAKWPEEYPGNHIRSEFTVAKDIDFKDVVDTITGTPEDGTLEIVYSKVVVPMDEVYYAKAVRYYDNGGNSGMLGPFPVHAADNINNENIKPNSTVDFPTVHIDLEEYNNTNSETFTVTTSNPRLKGPGKHKSTHWLITDEQGTVLYRKLYDDSNKLSLTINKSDIPFDAIESLTFRVAHVNSEGHESPFGILMLNVE